RSRKRVGEFRPSTGRTHISDANRRNARLRWFETEQGGALAALDAAPKLPLSGDDEMLVKRIRRDLNSDPFSAAGNHGKYRRPSRDNPKVMLQLWRIFFDCRFWTKLSDFGTRVTGKSVPQAHVFVAGESIHCFDEVAQRFCLAHF